MKIYNIWQTCYKESFEYYGINEINEFLKKIDNSNYNLIVIKNNYIRQNVNSNIEEHAQKENIMINYTDKNHAFLIGKDYNSRYMIIISEEAYEKYKEKIVNEININIIKNLKEDEIVKVKKFYYSDDLLKKLIQAKVKIELYDITLNQQQLELIRNSGLDIRLFVDNKEEILSRKYLIGTYTLNDLKNKNKIEINSNTKSEELENINLINENATLIIRNVDTIKDAYTNDLNRIISIYYKLNKKTKLLFEIERRKELYELIPLLRKCKGKNIRIICDHIEYTVEEYIIEHEKLENCINDIKNSKMSPLEKYFAVYNIVKKFKPYKENKEDLKQARKIKYILNNNYIVCMGYCNLLIELLDRIGIEACDYVTNVYDYELNKKEGHARTIININDDKYNVNGYYIADVTWDNHKNKNDTYDYALRPFHSMQKSEDSFELVTCDYILDNKDFNEFCTKINIYLNKKTNRGMHLLNAYNSIYIVIMNLLKQIDYDKYEDIIKYINRNEQERNEQFYEQFLTEIGHYIIKKSNKEIPVDIIAQAIAEAKFYNENVPESLKKAYEAKIIREYADYCYDINDEKLIEKTQLDGIAKKTKI